jgi:hypothetical protein
VRVSQNPSLLLVKVVVVVVLQTRSGRSYLVMLDDTETSCLRPMRRNAHLLLTKHLHLDQAFCSVVLVG